jgi:hypothetical protein
VRFLLSAGWENEGGLAAEHAIESEDARSGGYGSQWILGLWFARRRKKCGQCGGEGCEDGEQERRRSHGPQCSRFHTHQRRHEREADKQQQKDCDCDLDHS